jgi:hypothetical protein
LQHPKQSNYGKSFIPTEKQLAQWANQPITEGQKKAIRKTGIIEEELNQMTKLDAYSVINNNLKENL